MSGLQLPNPTTTPNAALTDAGARDAADPGAPDPGPGDADPAPDAAAPDASRADASAPADAGREVGPGPQSDGGKLDLLTMVPTPWAASWWDLRGLGPQTCQDGNAFRGDGSIVEIPKSMTTEPLLRFPSASHPFWRTKADGPTPSTSTDFCGRLTNVFTAPVGVYTVAYSKDDGVRIYIDGQAVVDDWVFLGDGTYTATWNNTTNGLHEWVVVFRDVGSSASLDIRLYR